MLFRKLEKKVADSLKNSDKILMLTGARQIGKSFLIRQVGKNFLKILSRLIEDSAGNKLFDKLKTTQDFYLTLASLAGTSFGTRDDTLIF